MQRVDSKDEKQGGEGSPCLRPRPCLIGSSGMPLSNTREVEVVRSGVIQFLHLKGKPLRCMSEIR
jgi:hypothetical protein